MGVGTGGDFVIGWSTTDNGAAASLSAAVSSGKTISLKDYASKVWAFTLKAGSSVGAAVSIDATLQDSMGGKIKFLATEFDITCDSSTVSDFGTFTGFDSMSFNDSWLTINPNGITVL